MCERVIDFSCDEKLGPETNKKIVCPSITLYILRGAYPIVLNFMETPPINYGVVAVPPTETPTPQHFGAKTVALNVSGHSDHEDIDSSPSHQEGPHPSVEDEEIARLRYQTQGAVQRLKNQLRELASARRLVVYQTREAEKRLQEDDEEDLVDQRVPKRRLGTQLKQTRLAEHIDDDVSAKAQSNLQRSLSGCLARSICSTKQKRAVLFAAINSLPK